MFWKDENSNQIGPIKSNNTLETVAEFEHFRYFIMITFVFNYNKEQNFDFGRNFNLSLGKMEKSKSEFFSLLLPFFDSIFEGFLKTVENRHVNTKFHRKTNDLKSKKKNK